MTDDTTENERDGESSAKGTVSTPYKVLGRIDATDGVGVLGTNDATDGTPVGVRGSVAGNSGYGLHTPGRAKAGEAVVTGTVDTEGDAFTLTAGTTTDGKAKNIVMGHASNQASFAAGAVIGGGGYDDGSTAEQNKVVGNFPTIGGGRANEITGLGADHSTISGGRGNTIPDDCAHAAIGGGQGNTIKEDSTHAAIGGGEGNTVRSTADHAFVGAGKQNAASANRTVVGGGFGNAAGGAYATVGGGASNEATEQGSVVGGGYDNLANGENAVVGAGSSNEAKSPSSFVGGGFDNTSDGYHATIGGGSNNTVTNSGGTIGGGSSNTVDAEEAVVPGGKDNTASGYASFAAGFNAVAANDKAFVWNSGSTYHDTDDDQTTDALSSAKDVDGSGVTGSETFHVSATGGIRFITAGGYVTYISANSSGWNITSSRSAKTNVEPVDTEAVLDSIADMEVSTWEYRDDDGNGQGERHIGPMAEEFHEAVDVGNTDEHINSINADGVLFAAVQGLSGRLDRKDDRVETLETENEQLRTELDGKDERIDDLEARIERLEQRWGEPTDTALDAD